MNIRSAMEVAELSHEPGVEEEDDRIAREDTEREKLLKCMSINFLLDAFTEAENVDLVRMVDAFKEGDTLRLGNLVRDRINEYMETVR